MERDRDRDKILRRRRSDDDDQEIARERKRQNQTNSKGDPRGISEEQINERRGEQRRLNKGDKAEEDKV